MSGVNVAVGRDYFGDTIRGLPKYHELERELDRAYPERFAEPLKRRHGEFASSYIFSFLEACIARCGRDRTFAADSAAVRKSIDELLGFTPYNPPEDLDGPTLEDR